MIDSATLIRDNTGYLRQATNLIHQLSDDLYANNNSPFFRSGAGRHIRHILGFYQCFLIGQDGKIDYDARNRDERVETDRDYAIGQIENVVGALSDASAKGWENIDLRVKNDDLEERSGDAGFSRSTIQRELQFLASHTVHHFAIVAMILKIQGFETPDTFGVAPSTLKYENRL